MQEFLFKYVEETDSFCAIHYHGDEADVIVPPLHWGKSVTIHFDAPEEEGKCIYSGKPSHRRVVFACSY